jgi:hypothetical protein
MKHTIGTAFTTLGVILACAVCAGVAAGPSVATLQTGKTYKENLKEAFEPGQASQIIEQVVIQPTLYPENIEAPTLAPTRASNDPIPTLVPEELTIEPTSQISIEDVEQILRDQQAHDERMAGKALDTVAKVAISGDVAQGIEGSMDACLPIGLVGLLILGFFFTLIFGGKK